MIIGLIFIYFLGKHFYQLAEKFNKHKWGFAIAGVVTYYVGSFIGGVVIVIVYDFILGNSIDDLNDTLLGLLGIPFGALACYGLYHLLKKKFEGDRISVEADILDDHLTLD